MIINKENIITYKNIFLESTPKLEIVKYVLKRLLGINAIFSRNVLMKDGNIILNCGKIMENCKVACSNFEKGLEEEFRGEKGIFVDVGAHIGKHSIHAAKNGFKVISIEADSETAELLRHNIQLNKCQDKINVYECVCLDKLGEADYYRSKLHPATNSLIHKEGKMKVTKKTNTLDNILKGMKNIKLIKIDVEGVELQVLKGGEKTIIREKPKIIFEAWDKMALKPIKDYLLNLGYSVTDIGSFNYLANWNN